MMIALNLGCGGNVFPNPDWVNIDIHPITLMSRVPGLMRVLSKIYPAFTSYKKRPLNIMYHDIRRGLPFKNDSVDCIYASHFLEHVEPHEAEKILSECHRALKPNGLIRIVVPDLKHLARKYLSQDREFFERHSFSGDDLATVFLRSLDFFPTRLTRRIVAGQYHRWMYDFDSLCHALKKSGFTELERKENNDSAMADVRSLEVPLEYNLCIEARKERQE